MYVLLFECCVRRVRCSYGFWDGADFSRKDYTGPPLKDLTEIIKYVQPTALLGLSTIKVRLSVRARSLTLCTLV